MSAASKPFAEFWREYARSPAAVAALGVLLLLLLGAALAPWLAPQNPYDLASLRLEDSRTAPLQAAASGVHYLFGSDVLGRDVLSAILYGLRMSLMVGLTAGLVAFAVGVTVGLFSAYRGGRVDALLMRLVDLQLSFPTLLVALILLAVLGKGLDKIVLALIIVQWAPFARTARAAALPQVHQEYMDAARVLRLPLWRMLLKHLLPNCLPPLLVVLTIQVASAILLESTLSYLGIGLPVSEPSLGLLIANGSQFLLNGDYWISLYPGLALLLLVGSLNLVGDRLREYFNPRLRKGVMLPLDGASSRRAAPARPASADETPLRVEGLSVVFDTPAGPLHALDGVSLSVRRGEVLGLVGESGSGKSMTARAIMGMINAPGRVTAGQVLLQGEDLAALSEAQLREKRGRDIALIFQDPTTALNPVLRIGSQMVEAVRAHRRVSDAQAQELAAQMLGRVGIPSPVERLQQYPHQLSGGMRQRVAIAIALLNRPSVILADEPTTALDVTIQSQILAEFQSLAREEGMAAVWVTHDLGVVEGLTQSVAVMYRGRIVEQGPTHEVLAAPAHPYTRGLLDSLPAANTPGQKLKQIPGMVSSKPGLDPGCGFRERCARADASCATPVPVVRLGGAAAPRSALCHHPLI
ncbi:MAG: dipeptide/oligopeptide/nickel ABC transporter permease/ATP-binding protein [Comamonadaceae bacterium]|nr:dipeptide/oligopeptide/nickel ABC transporter permease/ATP-binding protein [Comamonadaceae bacterium]